MLKSMTGFGRSVSEIDGFIVTVEIKTLNSKQTDIYCRLPRSLSSKEIEIRNLLNQVLERGKIELNLNLQKSAERDNAVSINRPLVNVYLNDILDSAKGFFSDFSNEEAFKIALSLPNAYNSENGSDGILDFEWEQIQKTIQLALQECNEFRVREGGLLTQKFIEYIAAITDYLAEVEKKDLLRIPAVREKLRKSVVDLVGDESFDKNRFAQEMIYYVEKYDISEEKQRLSTHLKYFIEILKEEGNGKKLNFMAQELGREINTIGSKANDVDIQHLVVNMKEELEKIKEQTANIL
ncbi:MAG: YicC/YloC family endoribonuclease [Bacteroidota bacterium]